MAAVLILGCGYVGTRIARRLLAAGERVHATSQHLGALAPLAARGAVAHQLETRDARSLQELERLAAELGSGLRVLVSLAPPDRADETRQLLQALGAHPARVVLLSTTAVYGARREVDEHTAPAPADEAGRAWLALERSWRSGPWSTLVLRCAAIYGPGRGLHATWREQRPGRVRDPDRVVSRVHVDDLAALAVAALRSGAEGTWPIADDEPATARAAAASCAELGPPLPPAAPRSRDGDERGRRVNGRAVRRVLGVELRYPSYREGIPASIQSEREED